MVGWLVSVIYDMHWALLSRTEAHIYIYWKINSVHRPVMLAWLLSVLEASFVLLELGVFVPSRVVSGPKIFMRENVL